MFGNDLSLRNNTIIAVILTMYPLVIIPGFAPESCTEQSLEQVHALKPEHALSDAPAPPERVGSESGCPNAPMGTINLARPKEELGYREQALCLWNSMPSSKIWEVRFGSRPERACIAQ
jgi:hypothetical protein